MSARLARILLALIPCALWLACWPFVDSPINDDFGYAFTAKRLAEAGRFEYGGWTEPLLGIQAAWAVPFIKIFGFSHDTLRLSMVPVSVAVALLTISLHRRLGVGVVWSFFASLFLVTSPLFTPWSASFMTDVPGVFFLLLVLHGILSLRLSCDAATLRWPIASMVIVGLLGGSVRQFLFAFAAAALLMEAWHRRRDVRSVLFNVGGAGTIAILGWLMIRWGSQQPYHRLNTIWGFTTLPALFAPTMRLLLETTLFLLPLLIALLPRLDLSRWRLIAAMAVTLVLTGARFRNGPDPEWVMAPWIGNTITAAGMLGDELDAPGRRPEVIPPLVQFAFAAMTWWMVAIAFLWVWQFRRQWATRLRQAVAASAGPKRSALLSMLALAFIFTVLLLSRSAEKNVFDRYLLTFLPIASAVILTLIRHRLTAARPNVFAWLMLAFYALAGVAFTSDHFAELRARERFTAELIREGIQRNAICNDMPDDAWLQFEAEGHLGLIETPETRKNNIVAIDPGVGQLFWFLPMCPTIWPDRIILNVRSKASIGPDDRAYRFESLLTPSGRWLVAWKTKLGSRPSLTGDQNSSTDNPPLR